MKINVSYGQNTFSIKERRASTFKGKNNCYI